MKLDSKLNEALNQQINEEFYSAYLYLAMAAYCEAEDLAGFAHWMHQQYREELTHAEKIYAYVNDRDGRVSLQAIKEPPSSWDSPLALFETALEHEQHITACIHKLADLCQTRQDHATAVFLQWFINEQVEEEKTTRAIIQDLKLVKNSADGIFMINRELAQRVPEAGE